MDNKTLYEQDFYLWIRTTINQLQARQFERVDLENLLEELASMGRSEKRKIENLYSIAGTFAETNLLDRRKI